MLAYAYKVLTTDHPGKIRSVLILPLIALPPFLLLFL